MIALVRIALHRPYTFVVLALLLLIVGPLAALRTPTDIFPDIRIPVIGVVKGHWWLFCPSISTTRIFFSPAAANEPRPIRAITIAERRRQVRMERPF